jgi:ribose transport system permease protein
MATGMELSAIAAAVIGGTSILGGEGAIWRGVVGALLLTLIGNGFNLLGWNTTYQQVVQGCLILLAVTLDRYLRKRTR